MMQHDASPVVFRRDYLHPQPGSRKAIGDALQRGGMVCAIILLVQLLSGSREGGVETRLAHPKLQQGFEAEGQILPLEGAPDVRLPDVGRESPWRPAPQQAPEIPATCICLHIDDFEDGPARPGSVVLRTL